MRYTARLRVQRNAVMHSSGLSRQSEKLMLAKNVFIEVPSIFCKFLHPQQLPATKHSLDGLRTDRSSPRPRSG